MSIPQPCSPVNIQALKDFAAADPERAYRLAGFRGKLHNRQSVLLGYCPLCREDEGSGTPHFYISLRDKESFPRGAFKCHKCEGGDVLIFFVRQVKGRPKGSKATAADIRELGELFGLQQAQPPSPTADRKKPTAKQAPKEAGRREWPIQDADGNTVATHHRADYDDGTKKLWWERDGKKTLGDLSLADLPLYPAPTLRASDPGATVILVEGEKAADALAAAIAEAGAADLVAVGTVTGAAGTPGDEALGVLAGRDVVLWPDNDGPGQRHMRNIAARLRALGVTAKIIAWADAPEKGDAADFVQAGGTLADLRVMIALAEEFVALPPAVEPPTRKTRWTAKELIEVTLPETKWAVEGLIAEGLNLLGSKPKAGKTLLAMQIACAVGSPTGRIFDKTPETGPVLFIELEDGPKRIKRRITRQCWNGQEDVTFETDWPAGADGLALLQQTLREKSFRLVVIDTLELFYGLARDTNDYSTMVQGIKALQRLAQETETPLLVLTHHHKLASGDPVTDAIGSIGQGGTADNLLGLYHERGATVWTLAIRGRDIDEEKDILLSRDPETWTSHLTDDQVKEGTRQAEVFHAIDDLGGTATGKQIGEWLETKGRPMKQEHISRELGDLATKKKVILGAKEGKEQPYIIVRDPKEGGS